MKKENGSSFYQLEVQDDEFKTLQKSKLALKNHYRLYYSGRSAIFAILEEIHQKNTVNTIWLPEYYCHNVLNFIKRNYTTVKLYYINPFNYKADFNFQRFAKKGDVIILNNFWGLFTYSYNNEENNRPIIIEDHSHGWLSKQSLQSKADYCISSVRKTYPIAGGGVTWIPNSKNKSDFYDTQKDNDIEKAHQIIGEKLQKKRLFLKEGKGGKDEYLNLLNEGESFITKSNSYVKPNDDFIKTLKTYITLDPNVIKRKNLDYILTKLNTTKAFKILDRKGYTPFGLLLIFNNEEAFLNFKSHCVNNSIFPANLWPNNDLKTQWKYFFNIHLDFRYTTNDMDYIASTINTWIKINS